MDAAGTKLSRLKPKKKLLLCVLICWQNAVVTLITRRSSASGLFCVDEVHVYFTLAFDAFLAQNPKLSYRLQRYETLIGYPVQGEMGRMRDNDTGRIIYLPWPK